MTNVGNNNVRNYAHFGFAELLCILIAFRIFLWVRGISGVIVEYAIWSLSLLFATIYMLGSPKNSIIKYFLYFVFISIIQTFGLIQLSSFFSLKNILASICIGCFFLCALVYTFEKSIKLIRVCFFAATLYASYIYVFNHTRENTLPACLMFMSYCHILLTKWEYKGKKHIKPNIIVFFKEFGVNAVMILLMVFVSFKAAARTTLATSLIIFTTYIALTLFKPKEKAMRLIFWMLVFSLLCFIIVYSNIDSFDWYQKLNQYSLSYFNKNIDSSRAFLWKESIGELAWWQYIIGGGTGRLPSIERFANSSFHSSYIQLFMQNGIIGIAVLIMLFRKIWFQLSKHIDNNSIALCFAIFVGVIIYNAMECSLLQNKAFLGMFQWLCLGVGTQMSYILDDQIMYVRVTLH